MSRTRAADRPKFPPPPKWVYDLIHKRGDDGKRVINRTDLDVLRKLVRLRLLYGHSCWCCKKTIARMLNCDPKTVARSLKRLGKAGVIQQVQVPTPDPIEPKNKTGWRIYFLWMIPCPLDAPGPDRRPPEERRKYPASVQAGEDKTVLLGEDKTVLLGEDKTVLQPKPELTQAENKTTTTSARETTPPVLTPSQPSPSPFASLSGGGEKTRIQAAAEQACHDLDVALLAAKVLALLDWPAEWESKARAVVLELRDETRSAERVLAILAYGENFKAKGGVIRGKEWFFGMAQRWRHLGPLECQEKVLDSQPKPKPGQAPPKTPGQVWVETLEADGFVLRVLPDGRFEPRKVYGDAPLNQTAVAMLRGQFRESALEFLAERERGAR